MLCAHHSNTPRLVDFGVDFAVAELSSEAITRFDIDRDWSILESGYCLFPGDLVTGGDSGSNSDSREA